MKLVVIAKDSRRPINIAWVFLGLKKEAKERLVIVPYPGLPTNPPKWVLEFPGQVRNPKNKLERYGYVLVEVLDWGEAVVQENPIEMLSKKLIDLGASGEQIARNLLEKLAELEELEKKTTLRRVK